MMASYVIPNHQFVKSPVRWCGRLSRQANETQNAFTDDRKLLIRRGREDVHDAGNDDCRFGPEQKSQGTDRRAWSCTVKAHPAKVAECMGKRNRGNAGTVKVRK